MTHATDREFHVRARHVDSHHARSVHEQSFEAAAVAYVEDLHDLGAEDELSIIVRDAENGAEHCFRVDLISGETSACS